jgi:peroxin-13
MGSMYNSPMGMGMGGMGMYNSPYMNSPYGAGGQFPGQPGQPPSLTQTLESTTHQTFALIHSIVQTFGGVAQMLESTFMATHSSFFAMVGVVDQFTMLRNALGSVLGVFGLLRWLKESITGRPAYTGEFKDFVNGRPVVPSGAPGAPGQPKINKKPLVLFLLALFGVPYLMAKFIRLIAARQQEALMAQGSVNSPLGPLDPSQLTFARALYPFTPSPSNPHELGLKENEIVAIMGKLDPRTGGEVDPRVDLSEVGGGEWWRGRTRDGREGWFPRKWVEIIQGKQEPKTVD